MKRLRYWIKQRLSWVLVPIQGGPIKGYRFGLFTGTRFIRGTYHRHEAERIERLANAGDVVFDIGAHVGYYTVLASRVVGDRGRVFAFEPLPLNLEYLNRHIRSNRLTNVTVFDAAVGSTEGRRPFDIGKGSGRGRLDANSDNTLTQVQVLKLDALFREGRLPCPNLIKMDIEGGEAEALRGATVMLSQCCPIVLLSTHGPAVKIECKSILASLGYRLSYLSKSDLCAIPPEKRRGWPEVGFGIRRIAG